jgi:hypothetical protein
MSENNLSSSELEKITDKCFTNLKILSNIQPGNKLYYNEEISQFDIDQQGAFGFVTQAPSRWWFAQSRMTTIQNLEIFSSTMMKTIDSIYNSEISENNNGIKNSYYTNITSPKIIFREENSNLLLSYITEMRNAIKGLNNLKQTYVDDISTVSSLDIIIEKMNVRIKKISNILQINKNNNKNNNNNSKDKTNNIVNIYNNDDDLPSYDSNV